MHYRNILNTQRNMKYLGKIMKHQTSTFNLYSCIQIIYFDLEAPSTD